MCKPNHHPEVMLGPKYDLKKFYIKKAPQMLITSAGLGVGGDSKRINRKNYSG
jgi:hypothetical protein